MFNYRSIFGKMCADFTVRVENSKIIFSSLRVFIDNNEGKICFLQVIFFLKGELIINEKLLSFIMNDEAYI